MMLVVDQIFMRQTNVQAPSDTSKISNNSHFSFFIKSISGLLLLLVLPFANRSTLAGLKPFFPFLKYFMQFQGEKIC
jgi:hypothetical protein